MSAKETKHMTLKETAEALECSEQTVWNRVYSGELKPYKVRNPDTRRWRRKMFRTKDVERLVKIAGLKPSELRRRLVISERLLFENGWSRRGGEWVKKDPAPETPAHRSNPKLGKKGRKKR